MKIKFISLLALGFVASAFTLKAQFIEDALRLATPNGVITARAGALGVSYNGIADDIGSLYYNPAGLSLLSKSELSIGVGFTRNNNETEFLGLKSNISNNDQYISNIGIAAPFGGSKKIGSFGISYFMDNDFVGNHSFEGFNTNSSFINWEAQNGPVNLSDNISTFLSLADSTGKTPVTGNVSQRGFVREKGGMHNIVGGAGFDLNDNFAVGFSITGKWGSYSYQREYDEWDSQNMYQNFMNDYSDLDFKALHIDESVDQTISGITAAFGFQGKIFDFMRIGATVKLPTWYEVEEDYSQTASAEFDNGDVSTYPYKNSGSSSYNITTPFAFSGGVSANYMGLTLTAGIEYSDAAQLEFTSGPDDLQQLNLLIAQTITGQTTWGIGAEYEIPVFPAVVRASYSNITSPYKDNYVDGDISVFALGGGFYFGKNIRLDILARWRDGSEFRSNYGYGTSATDNKGIVPSNYTMKLTPLSITAGFTYRY